MALGAGSVTPMQMATAYSVFANGGYRVNPYLIARVTDYKGRSLVETTPAPLDENARVIDARNAFVMTSLLREVTTLRHRRQGPGHAAAHRHLRKDRHHQRLHGRLVCGLPANPGRHRLDGL